MIRLVYLGPHFYRESNTIMSALTTEGGDRYDYGKLQGALEDGEDVSIRQATPEELVVADNYLAELRARNQ